MGPGRRRGTSKGVGSGLQIRKCASHWVLERGGPKRTKDLKKDVDEEKLHPGGEKKATRRGVSGTGRGVPVGRKRGLNVEKGPRETQPT